MNLLERINKYLDGQLSEQEAGQLWVELLRQPEYIDLLEIEMTLREWFKEG